MTDPHAAEHRQQRYDHGFEVLSQVNPQAQRFVDSLADISPELGRQVVSWAFGDVYSRDQLVPRDRQLITLGILTALGGCEPQLDVHIRMSLQTGLTPEQIVEAMMHAAVYAGMPRALNATAVARRVFGELGLLPIDNLS
jgi:4-carboxymuconolactone decarboxylase